MGRQGNAGDNRKGLGMSKEKGQVWAKVLLYEIDQTDESKRKRIAKWLREQATMLLKEHATLSKRYRARYWK